MQGGAIYIASNAICNIDGASFESNTAGYNVSRAATDLESCRADLLYPCPGFHNFFLLSNFSVAQGGGGAIFNAGTLHVTLANFTRNQAFGQAGGAIYIDQYATCNIDGGTFLSNTAGDVSQQRK